MASREHSSWKRADTKPRKVKDWATWSRNRDAKTSPYPFRAPAEAPAPQEPTP